MKSHLCSLEAVKIPSRIGKLRWEQSTEVTNIRLINIRAECSSLEMLQLQQANQIRSHLIDPKLWESWTVKKVGKSIETIQHLNFQPILTPATLQLSGRSTKSYTIKMDNKSKELCSDKKVKVFQRFPVSGRTSPGPLILRHLDKQKEFRCKRLNRIL